MIDLKMMIDLKNPLLTGSTSEAAAGEENADFTPPYCAVTHLKSMI